MPPSASVPRRLRHWLSDSATASKSHAPRGLVVLEATYDPTTRELLNLKDPYKNTAPFGDTASSAAEHGRAHGDRGGGRRRGVGGRQ